MANLYLFRGISATGKTTLTNAIAIKLGLPVLRKDDIYDSITVDISHADKNITCYDTLSKICQTNLDNGIDVIADIALPHKPYTEQFLNKLDLRNHTLVRFLCVCSSKSIWLNRWAERIKNPTPNQLFTDLDEIDRYYSEMDLTPFENEIVLDSVNSVKDNTEWAICAINQIKNN